MKPLFNIYLCLFASLLFIAACNDSDEEGLLVSPLTLKKLH